MSLGKNTPSAARLREIVAEIEEVEAEKKTLAERLAAIFAQAKTEGFTPAGIRYVIRQRKKSPTEREDEATMRDLYMHTMGMDDEPPLFRQLEAMAGDAASRDTLIEALLKLVPHSGEIIVKVGDRPVRLWRDHDGTPHQADWSPDKSPPPSRGGGSGPDDDTAPLPFDPPPPPEPEPEAPPCTEDEAEEQGRQAARDGVPIVKNPFRHDDPRRARWDQGWCDESGTDGMGPKRRGPKKGGPKSGGK